MGLGFARMCRRVYCFSFHHLACWVVKLKMEIVFIRNGRMK